MTFPEQNTVIYVQLVTNLYNLFSGKLDSAITLEDLNLIITNLNQWDHLLKPVNKAKKVIRKALLSSIPKQWELSKAKCWRVVQMMISQMTSFWWDHLPEPNNLVPNNENRVAFHWNDRSLAVYHCRSFETISLSLQSCKDN